MQKDGRMAKAEDVDPRALGGTTVSLAKGGATSKEPHDGKI